MVNYASDFLGVPSQSGYDLLRVSVKHNCSLVHTTCSIIMVHVTTAGGGGGESPVRTLVESPERSRASIPGELALWRPWEGGEGGEGVCTQYNSGGGRRYPLRERLFDHCYHTHTHAHTHTHGSLDALTRVESLLSPQPK